MCKIFCCLLILGCLWLGVLEWWTKLLCLPIELSCVRGCCHRGAIASRAASSLKKVEDVREWCRMGGRRGRRTLNQQVSKHSYQILNYLMFNSKCCALLHYCWLSSYAQPHICRANVSDNSGSQVPLSSILSPLSLAASTQIDSYFSSSFIPLYTVNVHFQDIQATLLHSTNTKCTPG